MSIKSVSVIIPCLINYNWQYHLTRAVISAAQEFAFAGGAPDVDVEYIVCSAGPQGNPVDQFGVEKFYYNPNPGFPNADMNLGMGMAKGEIVVLLTNDVFVKPGWLSALLMCFDYPDCGIASLATSDHKEQPLPVITEGLWCPVMALRNRPDFRFDAEEFQCYWGDSDLIMRVYEAGFRAYRNRRVVCDHLGRMSNTSDQAHSNHEAIEAGKAKFLARWSKSPWFIYRVLVEGIIL